MCKSAIAVVSLACAAAVAVSSCSPGDTVAVRFPDGRAIHCDLATSEKAKREGLTIYDHLPRDRGMILVYQQEQYVAIWMPSSMKFQLDIIFLDGKKRVIHFVERAEVCPSSLPEECPSYGPDTANCKFVIEAAAGVCSEVGLKKGDLLDFKMP